MCAQMKMKLSQKKDSPSFSCHCHFSLLATLRAADVLKYTFGKPMVVYLP